MQLATLDRHAVVSGALAGLVVLVPAAVLAQLVVDDGTGAGTKAFFFAIVVFGLLTAGFGGARVGHLAPLSSGLLSALLAWAAVQGFGVVRRLVGGDAVSWGAVIFAGSVAATAGVTGAVFSNWFQRRIDAADAREWADDQSAE
ncbi:MAG: hypothetical protein GY929_09145 [Actinomycetia bacterium]|nr:hypothetical protein [Actinomycetes bacterium]